MCRETPVNHVEELVKMFRWHSRKGCEDCKLRAKVVRHKRQVRVHLLLTDHTVTICIDALKHEFDCLRVGGYLDHDHHLKVGNV